MLNRLLLKLLMWRLKCKRQRATRSASTVLMGEGSHPCQLQIDALDAAAVDADNAIAVLQDRAIALMECQMQNMQ